MKVDEYLLYAVYGEFDRPVPERIFIIDGIAQIDINPIVAAVAKPKLKSQKKRRPL